MHDPLPLLLTNAGAAGLIALLAWVASLTVRRQAVVHGLWLLALVKLVTPPIAPLPLVPAWPGLPLTAAPLAPTVVAMPPAATSRRATPPLTGEPARVAARPLAGVTLASASPPARSATPHPFPGFAWRAVACLA